MTISYAQLLRFLLYSTCTASALRLHRQAMGKLQAHGRIIVWHLAAHLASDASARVRSFLNTVEAYDPRADAWQPLTPLSAPRAYCASATVSGAHMR